jgi:coenzyme F420-reducing hydrogenase beta subunit
MSILLKKEKLFNSDGRPVVYTNTRGKAILPTPKIHTKNRATGLVTTKKLSEANNQEQFNYVSNVARYYVSLSQFDEVKNLILKMKVGDRKKVFSTWRKEQLVDYISFFIKSSNTLVTKILKTMMRPNLVDAALLVTEEK